MLSLPPGLQVFMAIAPVDMRKSFDGLTAAVRAVFERRSSIAPHQSGPHAMLAAHVAGGRLPPFVALK